MTKLLLAGIAVLAFAGTALSISPVYHNFGNVAVMGLKEKRFEITLSPGTARGTTLTYRITGPDAVDFSLTTGPTADPFDPNTPCPAGAQGVVCTTGVEFRPRSMGPKKADLIVSVGPGNWTSAPVEGIGVAALCTHTVVPCNYALHYSGVVSWSGGDAGANVDVKNGVASCNASGDTELTSGPGLIGVEFDRSVEPERRASSTWYRITVACPIRYPPEPARPAELGHGEFGSYKQPLGMTLAQLNTSGPPRLKGSDGEVSWNLCPLAQYVPRDSTTQGPHDPCPAPTRRAP